MRINEHDKVMIGNPEGVLARFDGKIGTVERIYPEIIPPLAIVKFEDDEAVASTMSVKVAIENLIKVEIEIRTEIPEGAKEISRADFKEALARVSRPDFSERSGGGMGAFLSGITTMIVGDRVEKVIFKDQDVVIMTEDEFISELWVASSPVAISENVEKNMFARNCFSVAMAALIGFKKLVAIIFGGSDD